MFWSNNAVKMMDVPNYLKDTIDKKGLNATMIASQWELHKKIPSKDPYDYDEWLMLAYDIDGHKDDVDPRLNLREWVYMNIYENIKSSNTSQCAACFENTKKMIALWFDYLDCNGDGLINAENIYVGMKHMKFQFKVKTTMVNDFVLKSMEWKCAALDLLDFTYGLLTGMMERVVFEHDMSEIELNYMKIVRRGKIRDNI